VPSMSRMSALALVLLIAVIVGFSFAGALRPTSPAQSGVQPLAAHTTTGGQDQVFTTDSNGFFTNTYYVRLGSESQVYFYALDYKDSVATVTITDQNATRDGIANPAASFQAHISNITNSNSSYLWSIFYQIPLTLAHGGMWNISINGSLAGSYSTSFLVVTYEVGTYLTPHALLPGHVATDQWNVYSTLNAEPVTPTTIQAFATYDSPTGSWKIPIGGIAPAAVGQLQFTLPLNATLGTPVWLYLWANTTQAGGNMTWEENEVTYVGSLEWNGLNFGGSVYCGGYCYSSLSYFAPGQVVYFGLSTVVKESGYWSAPAAGENVRLTFQAGGKNITSIPGGPALTGTTNTSGGFETAFLASSAAFPTNKEITLIVNVTDPIYHNATLQMWFNFTVQSSDSVTEIGLAFSQASYYSGDNLTVTWTIQQPNGSSQSDYTGVGYLFQAETLGSPVLAQGYVPAGHTHGTFSTIIPSTFTGGVYVQFYAANATGDLYQEAYLTVLSPQIILVSNPGEFIAGSPVTVTAHTEGSVLAGATLLAQVVDYWGNPVFSGPISGNAFTFSTPSANAGNDYMVQVSAESNGIVITEATIYVYELNGMEVSVSVSTPSQYSDQSYQPGETVTVAYTFTGEGGTVLPSTFEIYIYPGFEGGTLYGTGTSSYVVTSAVGTVSYTIPSGSPSGIQTFYFDVVYSGATSSPTGCDGNCYAYESFSMLVSPAPSALNLEVGGSGITVGWIILLVLIVVVAILVVVMLIRRRPPRASPSAVVVPSGAGDSTMGSGSSPPSGATSGPGGTPSWHEGPEGAPSGGSPPSGNPPLPTPPQNP
jgi:hypothetical protein